jgi:alpha-L-fucosidase 2
MTTRFPILRPWRITLLLAGLLAGFPGSAQAGMEKTKVDWPAFLGQHDMRFDHLPGNWTEAPHFGNAMLGSMLYQADDTLRLQIFRADVHDHRDQTHGWTAYSRPRFQIGHFSLHTVGKLTGCRWRKDLWNAELTGIITTDKGEIQIRHLVHSEDMAIITELTPNEGEKGFSWTWHPAEARTTRPGYPTKESEIAGFAKKYGEHYAKSLKVYQPNPPGRLETREHGPGGKISVWIQDLLVGGQHATAWAERIEGATRTHLATVAKTYPGATAADDAVSIVARFSGMRMDTWRQTHRDWWHAYYPRSFVDLPDQKLESLYWQTIYRYGCTSRTGRCFVDTAGIWFQGKSWPYFTADWNIQSAHWPVYTANRLDQGQELVNRLHDRREALIQAVRPVEWQHDSAYLALAVAGDLVGSRDDDARYFDLVGNLPWAMHNAWWQYRYSMDDTLLREKVFPLLRRAVNLYLHMIQESPDGHLRLPPTYSPETGVYEDCNFDLSLLKWGCHTLLKANERLQLNDPLAPRWQEIINRLPAYPADEHGFMLGKNRTSSPNHQHFSNLLMIYPLHLVNIEQPGTLDVLRRSFDRARSTAGPGQRQAMVQAHAGPIGAALGLGDETLDCLQRLQGDLYPNGLWYESPCIESSLAAAGIIQDMLLQSWSDPASPASGPLRVFPALPGSWQDIEFHDLRAEGAFLVSARRRGGKTTWVKIRSLAGEPCLVRPAIAGEITLQGQRAHKIRQTSPGTYEIDLQKGEEVLILPVDPSP